MAILLRSLAWRAPGDIVLVAAHTHTAVDTLLLRLDINLDAFRRRAHEVGFRLPLIKLLKVYSSQPDPPVGGRITGFSSNRCAPLVQRERRDTILIIGGTTSALLKMAQELSARQPYMNDPNGFQAPALIVDEASMMVLPHFLALASLVQQDGELMLSGDHRQLAPIVAHEWEKEDRPPVVLYQPFVSAYDAIRGLAQNQEMTEHAIRLSALRFTFRLPPVIRSLIARLYRLDNIELEGFSMPEQATTDIPEGPWSHVWRGETGLYLVVHTERESRQSNEIEAQIIEHILSAAGQLPESSIAVMTPHRAQRSLLKMRLEPFVGPVDIIDTVERLQGGERPTVIVSATVSDPSAIAANVEFILDLNRSNVAFSRTRNRLIVICPDTLLDHIPIEVEHYESAMLWKSLRSLCSVELTRTNICGHTVRVLTPAAEIIADVKDQPC